ncbi:MAG: hypothetical protein JWN46_3678, partial [Acidimicrobiales bacterium]|nr:hypothetical protein [Acidimicrobiales bacterium]
RPPSRRPPAAGADEIARRRRVVAFGAGAVVVLIVIVVITTSGGGGGGFGRCFDDLAHQVPAGDPAGLRVVASDLRQARSEGYVDGGTLEELGSSRLATGTYPGDLARRLRFEQLYDTATFTSRTGVAPSDIACSLTTRTNEVSSGSFNPNAVRASSLAGRGQLAATGDRLGFGNQPAALLTRVDRGSLADDERFRDVAGALRSRGAYSIVVERAPRADQAPNAAGAGITKAIGDQRQVMLVWRFGDDKAAEAGRRAMADHLGSVYQGVLAISPDALTTHGRLLLGLFPIKEPERWYAPLLDGNKNLLPPGAN